MASRQQYLLSPLDQLAPRSYTGVALVFPVTDYHSAIAVLQTALNRTCDQLPFLGGWVHAKGAFYRHQSFITFEIPATGPQIQEISAICKIPNYAELRYERFPFPADLFPSPAKPGAIHFPVLAASYTKIEGGLALCIVAHNQVVDEFGYAEILNLLAANAGNDYSAYCKATQFPGPGEILKRRMKILKGSEEVPRDVQNLSFEEVLKSRSEFALRSTTGASPNGSVLGTLNQGTNTSKIFAFSTEKIDDVKAALAHTLSRRELTTDNILVALIWTSITHVRATRPKGGHSVSSSTTTYPVSGRELVKETLSSSPFVGNATCYAHAETLLSEVPVLPSLQNPNLLVPIISVVARAASLVDSSHIASLVHLADICPDNADLAMSWQFDGPDHLHFVNWAPTGMLDMDFGPGVGQPGCVRNAVLKRDGVVTMLPRRRTKRVEKEDIEICVSLREDDLARLSESSAWRSWLANSECTASNIEPARRN